MMLQQTSALSHTHNTHNTHTHTHTHTRIHTALHPQVNEISWNDDGTLFFLTTGAGNIEVSRYPDLKTTRSLRAHTANVYCIAFSGNYMACGSADALVSLWTLDELVCVRSFSLLELPVRTLSFSHCGTYLAAGSEDSLIDIVRRFCRLLLEPWNDCVFVQIVKRRKW
jgi:WD40 repeat protein